MSEHYDPECLRLAKHFLADQAVHVPRHVTEAEEHELAQRIQDAIESWFEYRDGPDDKTTEAGPEPAEGDP